MDLSSSIGGATNFRLAMNFVVSVFHSFTLGKGLRYGLVVFGDSVKVHCQLFNAIFLPIVDGCYCILCNIVNF